MMILSDDDDSGPPTISPLSLSFVSSTKALLCVGEGRVGTDTAKDWLERLFRSRFSVQGKWHRLTVPQSRPSQNEIPLQ